MKTTRRERANAKTGFRPTETTAVTGWLQQEFPDMDLYETTGRTLQLDDRAITVHSRYQASNLHHLLAGEPLGDEKTPRVYSGGGYGPVFSASAWADKIMRVYGHPTYCIAAMERQMAWLEDQPESVQNNVSFDRYRQVLDLLRQRAAGQIYKQVSGNRELLPVPYDVETELARLHWTGERQVRAGQDAPTVTTAQPPFRKPVAVPDAIAEIDEQLTAIARRERQVRLEFKGVERVSFMNRTTPKIARGQAFDKEMAILESDRERLMKRRAALIEEARAVTV